METPSVPAIRSPGHAEARPGLGRVKAPAGIRSVRINRLAGVTAIDILLIADRAQKVQSLPHIFRAIQEQAALLLYRPCPNLFRHDTGPPTSPGQR